MVAVGSSSRRIVICPYRLLERRQIFEDCKALVTLHEAGNEWHVVPELRLPGGSVDYCLVSVRRGKAVDFVGIELQTLDTTGSIWPVRQRLLRQFGVRMGRADRASGGAFGMNWKMTAKTTLTQLHHKIHTFEHFSKKLVLVLQDHLLAYMKREFSFNHLAAASIGQAMHFHSYAVDELRTGLTLQLVEQLSTDAAGIATCLGLQADPKVELEAIMAQLDGKISDHTRITMETPPVADSLSKKAAESGD